MGSRRSRLCEHDMSCIIECVCASVQHSTAVAVAAASNSRRWSVPYNVRAFRITDYVILCVYELFFPACCCCLIFFIVRFNYYSQYLFCLRFPCCWFCCRRFYSITLVFHSLSIYCKIGGFFSLVTHLSYKDAIPIMAVGNILFFFSLAFFCCLFSVHSISTLSFTASFVIFI